MYIVLLACRISWTVVWTHLKQHILAVQRKHPMHSDAIIKWLLTYKCSHSLKLDIYAGICFMLEFAEDSYYTCFYPVVKLENQGEDQTGWFYLESGYQELAAWGFFSWYFAIKFQTGFVLRLGFSRSIVWLGNIFEGNIWEHNHCMLNMSVCLTETLSGGKSCPAQD